MTKLYYIVEDANWSIREDGLAMARYLKEIYGLEQEIKTSANGIRNSLVHFGSRSTLLPEAFHTIDRSNTIVLTWFHSTDEDRAYIDALALAEPIITCVHTTNQASADNLVRWGIPPEKILILPLGIDSETFRILPADEKEEKKRAFGLPSDRAIIGSFQKDGNYWGYGETAKLIKGPDVFCDVVERINYKTPVFVMLTGPSRGYVKERLRDVGINFLHCNLDSAKDVAQFYPLIDLYLVTSRVEGGPKAILESLCCGTKIVTTDVGMARDVISDMPGAAITPIDDTDSIVALSRKFLSQPTTPESQLKLRECGKRFDYRQVVPRYYEQLYKPLLARIVSK